MKCGGPQGPREFESHPLRQLAQILDLKNRKPHKPEPENNGGVSDIHNTALLPRAPISWSEQTYFQPSIKNAVLIAIALFAIATLVQIFQKNLITTTFFALLGAVILLNASKKRQPKKFEIGPMGIKTNDFLHRYGELKSFWIEYDPTLGIKELSLQTKKWYLPYVKIPIDEQNPVQLRLILLEFLPEVEHKDTLVEILARKLGL